MPNEMFPRMQVRVRGRSFMAFVLSPESPLQAWVAELDAQMRRSPGFFEARPVVVDFAAVLIDDPGLDGLLTALEQRGLSVIDVENAGELPSADPWKRRLVGGRDSGEVAAPEAAGTSQAPPPPAPEENALVLDRPVRSGQSVLFLRGDVTIIGAVSSAAEVAAGGSIHVYGALRGRAIAGALGNPQAGIFCQRFEAELVSIDGYYRSADDFDPALIGRPVAIRLIDQALRFTLLG
jgi:septum site-determining protein MinC